MPSPNVSNEKFGCVVSLLCSEHAYGGHLFTVYGKAGTCEDLIGTHFQQWEDYYPAYEKLLKNNLIVNNEYDCRMAYDLLTEDQDDFSCSEKVLSDCSGKRASGEDGYFQCAKETIGDLRYINFTGSLALPEVALLWPIAGGSERIEGCGFSLRVGDVLGRSFSKEALAIEIGGKILQFHGTSFDMASGVVNFGATYVRSLFGGYGYALLLEAGGNISVGSAHGVSAHSGLRFAFSPFMIGADAIMAYYYVPADWYVKDFESVHYDAMNFFGYGLLASAGLYL